MPNRFRPSDPRAAAEAAFKKATTKPPEPVAAPAKPALPAARELVTFRIDREVLEHYQTGGPGWQERMNAALRKAAGLDRPGARDEGLRPEELTSENDD